MLFKQLALAAAATAFAIVPEISEPDENIFKALPVEPETFQLPAEAFGQSLDVPCRQCRGRDTHLKLDFAVEDGSRLMVNGFELYPHADPWRGDLTADVVRASGSATERTLGYSLSVLPRAKDEEQQLELVDVKLRVIEVGHRFVDDIPVVKVGLIKAVTGDIVISDMQLMAAPEMPCTTMWCRAKQAVKGFGGCHRKGPHGPEEANHPPPPPHHKPHHHGRPHHHEPEDWNTQRDWRRLVRNVASHIVLPVLMGITAGVGVAFLAMFLCSVVYRISMFVRGGAQRRSWCPHHRRNSTQFPSAEEEKRGLLEDEEAQDSTPAPAYQAEPADK
ncbi:uncharacterized protein TrAtP1_008939 [Trichoderma atroviride]|uniref:DUF7728 domain-containing protein n=1 Tax=Hypocrea atroviridis (strain ATCC 20476 / IMI 206040) TaxID=452589 RepID=G9NY70_HYPAI|nr:uncharacterized protein TRIATDRAFT_293642 [Trichoderma atroviride IMI 206040]EHK44397.1 hypothetical protein TRIATDRAFT_293642 [Trichoderma atroviride IMI 206040]UKZ67781.1 hypothetical protein TrAtP1_008939 [Trichoderma atroviride]